MAVAYPIDVSQTKSLDFSGWAAESLDLAQSTVYPGKFSSASYNFENGDQTRNSEFKFFPASFDLGSPNYC
jgi:hypothetical protein